MPDRRPVPTPALPAERFRRAAGAATRAAVEDLEARRLLCSSALAQPVAVSLLQIEATAPAAAALTAGQAPSAAADGLPLLHSLPGAAAAVYLDFDGYPGSAPYDSDGDPSRFGPSEQAEITEAWRHVASYFSMFALDVTTELPSVPFSYSLVSNSVAGGHNIGPFPYVTPTNYNPSSHARLRQSALAHEIGHSFGLYHQSVFDRTGAKVSEYHPGHDPLHGSIMGLDDARDVAKWFVGRPDVSPILLQDDVDVIAGKVGALSGGDGFRTDDTPGAPDSARPLDMVDGVQRGSGIIERLGDADAFSFASAGGRVGVDVVPPDPSMLDAKLEVYAFNGTLVAAADGPENDQHLDFPRLPGGTYYVVVRSHGNYADLGPYDLTVREEDPQDDPDPRYNALPAPGGLTLSHGDGTGVSARWDPVDGATGYTVDRSADGLVWVHAGTTAANVTAFDDRDLPGSFRYFYRVSAADGSGLSRSSGARSLVNRPGAVTNLTHTNWRSQAFVLNWRDADGETGYRVERTDDGVGPHRWTVVAELAANVPGYTDRSIAPAMRYRYRVVPTGPSGAGPAAEVIAAVPLARVDGMRVAARAATSVDLAWDPIPGAVGYTVERSDDGVAFTPVETVLDSSYSDSTVTPLNRYYYRVLGANDLGESAHSTVVVGSTLSSTRLPAGWLSTGIGPSGAATGTDANGSAGYAAAGDAFTMIGAGAGASLQRTVSDSFRFVYRQMAGNGSITARVVSQKPPRDSAAPGGGLAGIMIREGTGGGDLFVFAAASTQSVSGYQYRNRANIPGPGLWPMAPGGMPTWLRLVRKADSVEVFGMRDGGAWQMWSRLPVTLPPTVLVGLAASAGSESELSVATFDNVVINNGRAPRFESYPTWPAVIDGTEVSLTTLGSDDAGEDFLTYTWSVTGAPAGARMPTFSDNNTNSAKAVTATFHQAGRYAFRVTITNPQRLSVSWNFAFEVVPAPTRLDVTPRGVPVHVGSTVRYSAALLDQFDRPYQPAASAPAPAVSWSAAWGRIDDDGNYTASDWPSGGWWDRVTASAEGIESQTEVYVYDESSGPTLLSAASRKVHGRRGVFDLPLPLHDGPPAVEPRRGGPTTLRFTFSTNVVADGGGPFGPDNFVLTNATFHAARAAGNVLTLELTDVADGSVVGVELAGLSDPAGRPMGGDSDVLVRAKLGDVDGDGTVGAFDVLALRARLRRPLATTAPFYDLDLDGSTTALDVLQARRRAGSSYR